MSNKKWKLEYTVTLFFVLGVILLLLPVSFGNTMQASLISKWNERFNRVEYTFSVIKAHLTDDTKQSFKDAENEKDREELMLQLIKPYLRVDTSKKVPSQYKLHYMDKSKVIKGQLYYIDEYNFVKDGSIIGIKDTKKLVDDDPIFIMMFDINGLLPPNTWGKDVFGVNIFDTGEVKPFGYNMSMTGLAEDCSKKGTGISCSYYYKIGGSFDDK